MNPSETPNSCNGQGTLDGWCVVRLRGEDAAEFIRQWGHIIGHVPHDPLDPLGDEWICDGHDDGDPGDEHKEGA